MGSGNSERSPLRRPNGRLQACDPCRFRKVACDHARPVCARCLKHGVDSQCVYTATVPRTRSSRTTPRNVLVPNATIPISISQSTHSSSSGSPANAVAATAYEARSPSAVVTSSPGFLGYMSHNAVFQETKKSLSLLHGEDSDRTTTSGRGTHSRVRISYHALPSPLREMCLFVLRRLPKQAEQQMSSHPMKPQRWNDVAIGKIMHSLENHFGLDVQRPDSDLEQIAEVICMNTAKPLRDMHSSSQWMDQFTGPNLRWESIGLVWAYLEGLSNAIESLHPRSLVWLPGKQSPETCLLCLSYCIDLSCHFNQGNIIMLDLVRRKAVLQSMVSGDAGFPCYVTHGLAVSISSFLGLHMLEDSPDYRPSLCSEYKRIVFLQVFLCDKGVVSFTGRPPQMSLKYCSVPLPLDITDQDLIGDDETLLQAMQKLDKNGWSQSGEVQTNTLMRARGMFGRILDEVCEIALTNNGVTPLNHLYALQERRQRIAEQFPKCLQYSPGEWELPDANIRAIYAKLIVHLAARRIDFLIQRLLIRNGAPDEGDLLVTSFDMVTSTLLFWTHKDKFAEMQRNFDWLVMANAAPGGGILCQELLRQTFRGAHPKNPEITRSSIIQRLSLLIGFLDWTQPPAPNADLCSDCKQIIQRVLDHHLNAETNENGTINSFDWNLDRPLDFNFELLDTYDWIRTDYL